MTNREKCLSILDTFSEAQLANVAVMLQAARDAIVEAMDDAYCNALYNKYEQDPDKGQPVSIEDAAKMLGVTL